MLTDRLGQAIVRGCIVMEVEEGVLMVVVRTNTNGSCDTADCAVIENFPDDGLSSREIWLLAQWRYLRLTDYEVVGHASR